MLNKRDAVIISAVRTPIGTFGGIFRDLHDTDLSVVVIKELAKRARIEDQRIDDVV
jgi:acetyl-CoA C-acetyltransferase